MNTPRPFSPRPGPGLAWALALAVIPFALTAASPAKDAPNFVQKHCIECHDADTKKGGLDLTALKSDFAARENFARWEKVFDRVSRGEMPPRRARNRR